MFGFVPVKWLGRQFQHALIGGDGGKREVDMQRGRPFQQAGFSGAFDGHHCHGDIDQFRHEKHAPQAPEGPGWQYAGQRMGQT
tara:strand:+ start:547 stop:795 length:249 start_codon:yes stop_codon:yes gene_type:complete